MNTPKMSLVKATNTSTTYQFKADERHGWALCTVNDGTGELLITSDWGNWSYMWNPNPHQGLGAASLTHFIGERNGVDYIADKLLGRRGSQRFSTEATVAHFRAEICKRRMTDGQEFNSRLRSYGDERDQQIALRNGFLDKRYSGAWYLTKGTARHLWDEVQSIASDIGDHSPSAESLFIERFYRVDGHEILFEEAWDEVQHVESYDSQILRLSILPALCAACRGKTQESVYVELHEAFVAELDKRAAAREAEKAVAP